MTVPVALIATAGSLALVAAIVFAMRKGKPDEDDSDSSVRDSVRSETSVNTPAKTDYSGDTRYQFPSSLSQRDSADFTSARGSDNDIITIGGKRKSKRKSRKNKSKRKHSKRV